MCGGVRCREKIQQEPDDERMKAEWRLGAGLFVDEPGGDEDEDEDGEKPPGDEIDPRGARPVVDTAGRLPGPERVGRGERFEGEVEQYRERARDGDDPEAVCGTFSPGAKDEPGDAAGTQDGDGAYGRHRPGKPEDFGAEVAGKDAGPERNARLNSNNARNDRYYYGEGGDGSNVLEREGLGEVGQSHDQSKKNERKGRPGSIGETGDLENDGETGGGAKQEGGEGERLEQLARAGLGGVGVAGRRIVKHAFLNWYNSSFIPERGKSQMIFRKTSRCAHAPVSNDEVRCLVLRRARRAGITRINFMNLQETSSLVKKCADAMNTRYRRIVFDEWAIVSLMEMRGRVLNYLGPRNDDFLKNFVSDLGPLRAELMHAQHGVGDFEFTRNGEGTLFEAFMVLGQGVYLICNNTMNSMDRIARDALWIDAQVPFVELSDKVRSSPVVCPAAS